jgi:hypothetical protein
MGPERSWLVALVMLGAAIVVLALALLVPGSQPILPCQPHSLRPGGPLVCDGVPPPPQHEDTYPTDAAPARAETY